jgi:hypothetical protein
MKRLAIFLALLLVGATPAIAAPKPIAVKKLTLLSVDQGAELLALSGKTIVTIANSEGVNTNILLSGVDGSGVQMWQKSIDSGVDEVALAATTDSSGNIWLVGASAQAAAAESSTAALSVENPDGVVIEPTTPLRSDMKVLTIWKISTTGELLSTFTSQLSAPALITAISANLSGISIAGTLQDRPFIQNISAQGVFGKVIYIGTSKTSLNALIRQSDGSISVFGASSETLGGKKLAGRRDGVLIKVSKTGVIASVVRSSAPKADRAWLAADSSLALTGFVKSGKIIESAFTKFTSAFSPSWTLRVPSLGTSTVVSAGTTTYGEGAITNAFGSSEISEPIAMSYSKDLGVIGLARTSSQTISLYKLP